MRRPNVYKMFEAVCKRGLYKYQINLNFKSDRCKKLIINKSRQLGISTFYAVYVLLKAAYEDKKIVVVSPAERQSQHFLEIARSFSDYAQSEYPDYKDRIAGQNSTEIAFKNGGKVISLPNNPGSIRGYTADIIILDEFAFFENTADVWKAVLPMSTRGDLVVVISTPNGEGGMYHDFWKNYKKHGFERVCINYRECPDFDADRITHIKSGLSELDWRQEYENEFLGKRIAFFTAELLDSITDGGIIPANYPEQLQERLVFGVDIGRKADKTAIVGLSADGEVRYIQTLENTPFSEQKEILKSLLRHASSMKIDQNGIGMQLAEELRNESDGIVEPVQMTNQLKVDGFVGLRIAMEKKKFTMPPDSILRKSLALIERKQAGANITFDAPRSDETGHSDLAFALMLIYANANNVDSEPSVTLIDRTRQDDGFFRMPRDDVYGGKIGGID